MLSLLAVRAWARVVYKTCIVGEPPPPAQWPFDSTPVPSVPFFSQAFTRQEWQSKQGLYPSEQQNNGAVVSPPKRSVLLVNKVNRRVNITLPAAHGQLFLVDPESVGNSSASGIREVAVQTSRVELLPFAVGVFEMSQFNK
eukprot:COSAG02_NODE_458_length_21942_cov_1643.812068_5_plen_141_part_00